MIDTYKFMTSRAFVKPALIIAHQMIHPEIYDDDDPEHRDSDDRLEPHYTKPTAEEMEERIKAQHTHL